MKRIFVYGTLLRGERNHHLLGDSRFLGESRTAAGFELRDLGEFPAMLRSKRSSDVAGELYLVGPEVLPTLDQVEDHPDLFVRTSIFLASGEEAEAYLLPPDRASSGSRIPSGDWRQRRG